MSAAAEEQLFVQRVAALGWRAETVQENDYWLLRANRGWTGRANSALPLTYAVPEKSLVSINEFFVRRSLPTKVQVPLPACAALDEYLEKRGFIASNPTHVLTARIEEILDDVADKVSERVEISASPDEMWLTACESWNRELGRVGKDLLQRHPRVGFASIRDDDGEMVAVGRVVVDGEWAGLSTAAVHPGHRRLGLATTLLRARLRWASIRHDATHAYLQVEKHNLVSLALCRKTGFARHHDYHYRTRQA